MHFSRSFFYNAPTIMSTFAKLQQFSLWLTPPPLLLPANTHPPHPAILLQIPDGLKLSSTGPFLRYCKNGPRVLTLPTHTAVCKSRVHSWKILGVIHIFLPECGRSVKFLGPWVQTTAWLTQEFIHKTLKWLLLILIIIIVVIFVLQHCTCSDFFLGRQTWSFNFL